MATAVVTSDRRFIRLLRSAPRPSRPPMIAPKFKTTLPRGTFDSKGLGRDVATRSTFGVNLQFIRKSLRLCAGLGERLPARRGAVDQIVQEHAAGNAAVIARPESGEDFHAMAAARLQLD